MKAHAIAIRVEPRLPGCGVEDFIDSLCRFATEIQVPCVGNFNGVDVHACPGESPFRVMALLEQDMRAHSRARAADADRRAAQAG